MWYVVQSTDDKEIVAMEKCKKAIPSAIATSIFSPRYEYMRRYRGDWHIKEGILFPGYIFIESNQPQELAKHLEHISGVVTPVRVGGGFYPIRDDEEDILRSMLDETYCIRYSLGYIVDGRLVVERGPLIGKTQYVTKIDRHMRGAELMLHLFDKERRVQVGLEVPRKMTAEEYRRWKESA
jgi:transcriptional antiterminator NusG